MDADFRDVTAKYFRAAAGRKQQSHQYFYRRGLSGAIAAEKSEDLSGADLQGKTVERTDALVFEETGLVIL